MLEPTQKMLRQWNYRSHYHPNLTREESVHWDVHAGENFSSCAILPVFILRVSLGLEHLDSDAL